MSSLHHLIPFDSKLDSAFKVSARVLMHGSELRIRFGVRGTTREIFQKLHIPRAKPQSVKEDQPLARADRLWESTCFEAFFPEPGSEAYVEFNGSADHRWNLFQFEAYRSGKKEVPLKAFIPRCLEDKRTDTTLEIEWEIPRSALPSSLNAMGITAVLVIDGAPTYWALKHTSPEPDFHLRNSFTAWL